MKKEDFEHVEIGDKLFPTGTSKRKGWSGKVIAKSERKALLCFDDGIEHAYSFYFLQKLT